MGLFCQLYKLQAPIKTPRVLYNLYSVSLESLKTLHALYALYSVSQESLKTLHALYVLDSVSGVTQNSACIVQCTSGVTQNSACIVCFAQCKSGVTQNSVLYSVSQESFKTLHALHAACNMDWLNVH